MLLVLSRKGHALPSRQRTAWQAQHATGNDPGMIEPMDGLMNEVPLHITSRVSS